MGKSAFGLVQGNDRTHEMRLDCSQHAISAHAIAELLQFGFDAVGVVALDFDVVAVDGSAGAAGVFEFLQDCGQIVFAGNEIPDNGHHATVFSFLRTDA